MVSATGATRGQTARRHHRALVELFLEATHMPSMSDANPYKMPDCSDSTVVFADDVAGFYELDPTQRRGAAEQRVDRDLDARAIAPPMNSPLAEMMSKLVPVPKSTTIVGPP